MNTSTERLIDQDNKKTVPEMFVLFDIVKMAVDKGTNLREVLRGCGAEERAIIHSIFSQVKYTTVPAAAPRARKSRGG